MSAFDQIHQREIYEKRKKGLKSIARVIRKYRPDMSSAAYDVLSKMLADVSFAEMITSQEYLYKTNAAQQTLAPDAVPAENTAQ